jgi:hypothetical protein
VLYHCRWYSSELFWDENSWLLDPVRDILPLAQLPCWLYISKTPFGIWFS